MLTHRVYRPTAEGGDVRSRVMGVYPIPSLAEGLGERRKLPEQGLHGATNDFWTFCTHFCTILRVLLHFGSLLPGIITPKVQENWGR